MAKILLSEEVRRVQNELRRLSTLLRKIKDYKQTLKVEGVDKEDTIANFLQANINLLGSYSVDDITNDLDTNASVIKNLSIVASNVKAIVDREKNYASIDLTNVKVDVANIGKILSVGAGGAVSYKDENIEDITKLTTNDEVYNAVENGNLYKMSNGFFYCGRKTDVVATLYGFTGTPQTNISMLLKNASKGSNTILTSGIQSTIHVANGIGTLDAVNKGQLDSATGNPTGDAS